MKRRFTWLSDAEWARIEPLLPRGRKRHMPAALDWTLTDLLYRRRWAGAFACFLTDAV